MAKNYVDDGRTVTYSNGTGSDIAAGDHVTVGNLDGVALVDIADGDSGAVQVEGKFSMPKATGSAWNAGDEVAWDASAGVFDLLANLTLASGDVSECSVAGADADSADDEAPVILNRTPGTVTA